jgi:hypothetical protein
MKINLKYLLFMIGSGLAVARTSFACVALGGQLSDSFYVFFNYSMGGIIVIGMVLFSVPIIFLIFCFKRGGFKKRLIKYWGWSFFLILLALLGKGIVGLQTGCVN